MTANHSETNVFSSYIVVERQGRDVLVYFSGLSLCISKGTPHWIQRNLSFDVMSNKHEDWICRCFVLECGSLLPLWYSLFLISVFVLRSRDGVSSGVRRSIPI